MTHEVLTYSCGVFVMTEKLVGIKEIKTRYIIPVGCLIGRCCHHFEVLDGIRRAILRLVSQLVNEIIFRAVMISRTPNTISCQVGWWSSRDSERRRKNMILSSFQYDFAKGVGKLKARNFSGSVSYEVTFGILSDQPCESMTATCSTSRPTLCKSQASGNKLAIRIMKRAAYTIL